MKKSESMEIMSLLSVISAATSRVASAKSMGRSTRIGDGTASQPGICLICGKGPSPLLSSD